MNLLLAGQITKLAAGAAQFGFAVWLIAQRPRSAPRIWFAIAFGLNGIAYFLFNISPAGQRTLGSMAVEGRALFNWLAAAAMLAFGVIFLRVVHDRARAIVFATAVALAILIADILSARQYGLSLAAFGGIAIYPATAFVLGLLPFASEVPFASAFLTAALAINSVDHLGAEWIRPSPTPQIAVELQIAALFVVALVWLWKMEPGQRRSLSILVAACFVVPFLAGTAVRIAMGSYRGMQQSGLVGLGRIAATCVLVYGERAHRIFSISA